MTEGDLPLPAPDNSEVELIAAALRADAADLATFSRVLVVSLEGTLPQGCFEIERDRSLSDRLSGKEGTVRAIRIHLGEVTLGLTSRRGALVGSVGKTVRGVAISNREVTLAEWTQGFAEALSRFAQENADARQALGRLLGAEQ